MLIAPIGMRAASAGETWYVGKGMKIGDYYRYNLCQVDYKSCTQFEMDFWVEGKTDQGYKVQVLVIDGNKVVRGDMEVGKVAPEPIGFSKDMAPYASAYKSSLVWLSGFATILDPKDFDAPAWGKIGSIGGMPVGPTGVKETVTVPAGAFETYVIGWHKSSDNKIWVKPGFPFPVKALTFVDVSAGTIPVQYQFELLEYGNSASPPDFLEKATTPITPEANCPPDDSFVSGTKALDTHSMIVQFRYAPKNPRSGCTITWSLEFTKSFDPNQFESDVHYDIFVVDENDKVLRSFAQDEGKEFLYAPVGKESRTMDVKESAGTAHYVLVVYGTGPQGSPPDTSKSGRLNFDIDVVIPEFPAGVIIVMAIVVAMTLALTRFKTSIPSFKF